MAIPVIVHCTQILRYVLINVKCQLFLFWIHSRQVVKWNVYHISENSICFWKQAQFVLKDFKRLDHLVFFCRTVIRSCDEISTNDITALKFQPVCCHLLKDVYLQGWNFVKLLRCTIIRHRVLQLNLIICLFLQALNAISDSEYVKLGPMCCFFLVSTICLLETVTFIHFSVGNLSKIQIIYYANFSAYNF